MRDLTLFEAFVEPTVERIPLVDVQYRDETEARGCVVSCVIYRNVFTEFDTKLSRHLAARGGLGFPAISVMMRMRELSPTAPWHEGRPLHFPSVPHALRGIVSRALSGKDNVRVVLAAVEGLVDATEGEGPARQVDASDAKALGTALDLCRSFGAVEFLDLSGDFDTLMVVPLGCELRPVTIDIYRGTITVPRSYSGNDGFQGALYDFRRASHENHAARAYMAAARQAVTVAKEDAVMAFRSAAEERIHAFDRALRGRPLEAHRLDAVMSLVARLRAGLGDQLVGISEDARITALDWAEAMVRAPGAHDGQSAYDADPAGRGADPQAPGSRRLVPEQPRRQASR